MLRKKSMLAAAVCAVAVAGASASAALAGEVKGPPGTPNVPRTEEQIDLIRTGAPAHANSICAYNGLNDMNPAQGQIEFIVQTPHNQGVPGQAGHGTCGYGTNPENPPSP